MNVISGSGFKSYLLPESQRRHWSMHNSSQNVWWQSNFTYTSYENHIRVWTQQDCSPQQ